VELPYDPFLKDNHYDSSRIESMVKFDAVINQRLENEKKNFRSKPELMVNAGNIIYDLNFMLFGSKIYYSERIQRKNETDKDGIAHQVWVEHWDDNVGRAPIFDYITNRMHQLQPRREISREERVGGTFYKTELERNFDIFRVERVSESMECKRNQKENVIIIKNKNKCLEKMNIRVLYSKEPQVMGLYIRDEENKKAYQHWIKGLEYELAQVELKELREEFRQSLSISGDEKNNLDLIKDGRIFVFNEYSLNEIYSEGSKAKCDVSYENKDYKVGQFAIWYSYND
jgi:hypothetical protein